MSAPSTSARSHRAQQHRSHRPVLARSGVLAALVAVVLATGACTAGDGGDGSGDGSGDGGTTDRDVAAEARAVALGTPVAAPTAAPSLPAPAPAGTVALVEGPFTDRLVVHDAVLGADGHVRARLDVTKDVSELLALELDVAWYDADGALVGSTRHVVPPESAEAFHGTAGVVGMPVDVAPPGALAGGILADGSATVAVPVLVNE